MVTTKQGELLCVIQDILNDPTKLPPTRQELAKATGVKSVGTVNVHLKRLLDLGLISQRPDYRTRNLVLTDDGRRVAAELRAKKQARASVSQEAPSNPLGVAPDSHQA